MSLDFLELCQEAVERNNMRAFKFLVTCELKYPDKRDERVLPYFVYASIEHAKKEILLMAYTNLKAEEVLRFHEELLCFEKARINQVLEWIRDSEKSHQ